MLFNDFVSQSHDWWSTYLINVARLETGGHLLAIEPDGNILSGRGRLLFPSILVATQCKGFYVVELLGATPTFKGFNKKIHKEDSIYKYLSQFDANEPIPAITLGSANNGFRFLCLAQDADRQLALKRFPYLGAYRATLLTKNGRGSPLAFDESFRSCALENCAILNCQSELIRCKNILWCGIFKNIISKNELTDFFRNATRGEDIKGVHATGKDGERDEKLIVAGQLQSIYLFPHLRETTIGEFFRSHPQIIKLAFQSDHFEYEPTLEWKEHDGFVPEKAINPDLMVRRDDGYFDIYDLKTALLEKTSITKGQHSRRRFIDYVTEGISQLANYKEYFKYKKNADHARTKYGIEVNDPRLVLVVGSFENANIQEVRQACRPYSNIEIIDYDTLCQMFIGAPLRADIGLQTER